MTFLCTGVANEVMQALMLNPCGANAGNSQLDKPSPLVQKRPSLSFAPGVIAPAEQTPHWPLSSSIGRFVPWQPVESPGPGSEIAGEEPASLETVPSACSVPKAEAEAAPEAAELAPALLGSLESQVEFPASTPAGPARPLASTQTDPEPVNLSDFSSLALAVPQDVDSSARDPEALEGQSESQNRDFQPSNCQEGSACTRIHAELPQQQIEADGLSKVLSEADAQLLESCAVGPAHPCLLASDISEAALMKPVSSLGASE